MEKTARGEASKNDQFNVLIDSDAFIGWLNEEDAHHQRVNELFELLQTQQAKFVTISLVVAETATVLSYKASQSLALAFLKIINRGNLPVIHINEGLQQASLEIFSEQTKRRTSVTDCANVAVMRKYEIPAIFSFDQGYVKQFNLALIGDKLEGH